MAGRFATEDDLPPDDHGMYLKAVSAFELRNFAYAVALLRAVLQKSPEFLDGQKLLRAANRYLDE